jgi:hypothetical protein
VSRRLPSRCQAARSPVLTTRLTTVPGTQKALSLPGKGLDLRKLVAGADLNPRPLGYEPNDIRLCRFGQSPVTALVPADLLHAVAPGLLRLPCLSLSRHVSCTNACTNRPPGLLVRVGKRYRPIWHRLFTDRSGTRRARPLRPELAAPLGVWPSAQLAAYAAGRRCWGLCRDVAVLPRCTVHRIAARVAVLPGSVQAGPACLIGPRARRTAQSRNPNCNHACRRRGCIYGYRISSV